MSTPEENQSASPQGPESAGVPESGQPVPGFTPPESAPAYPVPGQAAPQPEQTPGAFPAPEQTPVPGFTPPAYGAPAAPQPGYGQPAVPPPGYGQPGYGQPANGQPGAVYPPLTGAPPVHPDQFERPGQRAFPASVSAPLASFTLIQYAVLLVGALLSTWIGFAITGAPSIGGLGSSAYTVTLVGSSIFTVLFAAGSAALIYFPVRRGRAWGRVVGTIFASIAAVLALFQVVGALIQLASEPALGIIDLILSLAAVAVSVYWLVLAWRKPRV
ncbi:hypothetical protein [Mycetocola saprophilus]|uniref:hypothetical protein n=1 Tax=Mycetocola saprophilus TaxID=76636 RepID=UPI0012DDF979|nr:hypothetical protein [Mycetocola saprophilus]